jgi:hypothetical protein
MVVLGAGVASGVESVMARMSINGAQGEDSAASLLLSVQH